MTDEGEETTTKRRRQSEAEQEGKPGEKKKGQPGPCANQDGENAENGQDETTRKHTAWEDIGIVEYNPKATEWECRFEDCNSKMATERIPQRRKRTP